MRLVDITTLGLYSVQGRKVKVLKVGVPYSVQGRPVGVEVREMNGKVRTLRAQDIDRAWTEADEQRLARRRERMK